MESYECLFFEFGQKEPIITAHLHQVPNVGESLCLQGENSITTKFFKVIKKRHHFYKDNIVLKDMQYTIIQDGLSHFEFEVKEI